MKQKSYALVINLKSRQAAAATDEIREVFKSKKSNIKIIKVSNPAKIKESYQQAMDLKPDIIILGGGDGTIINGIEYLSYHNFTGEIGILPLGTANYFARNLSIPLDVTESIDVLLNGKSSEVPIGVANGKFFALTFMVGLVQAAAENVSDKLKQKIGQAAYLLELFKQTKQHQPFAYRLESPDLKKPLVGTTHQILVYNSDINVQLKLVPDHTLEKPTLKVLVSRCGKSKAKFYFGFLVHIFSLGRIRPYMYTLETRSLKITTKPVLRADYDGETYGESPFEVTMCKHKVRVIR